MDKARIIIIEDDDLMRMMCRENLEVRKHVIVGEAGTLATAHELIESLTPEQVDIAIVDGNLTPRTDTGNDGENIAKSIHDKLPGVTVIGWSLSGVVRGADLNAPKHNAWALDAMVTELPPRE
jgi:DNA-binding NarL/FixJ family response regulator